MFRSNFDRNLSWAGGRRKWKHSPSPNQLSLSALYFENFENLCHSCFCLTSGNTKAVLAINNVASCLAFSCLKIDQKFYLWNKLLLHINTCQWYRSFEIAHTVSQGLCKITSKPKTNPICRTDRDSCYANHFRFIFPSYWGGV